jgi:sarcosine oxidase subunit alpha
MSGFRLPTGGSDIDRLRPRRFTFDGRTMKGYAGDTLASALIANGISIVGRSFKYHRPRGVMGTGFAEPHALVQIGDGDRMATNVPATLVPLTDGLEARSLNRWPSLRFDMSGVNDRLGGLLSAGFYYKSFMWPSWHLFEPMIRRAAGIGRAPALPDPDRYEARDARVDVLVIGGGVAGIAAATAAGQAGAKVMLVEADALFDPRGLPSTVTMLSRTTAIGYYDHNLVSAVETIEAPGLRERLWKIRARRVVLACGAFERPLLFANNDRPGVMLAGAVQDYLARHAVAAGRAPLFATTHDGAYAAAFAAQDAGLDVRGIVDARADETAATAEARARGIPHFPASVVARAIGRGAVRGVRIMPLAGGTARSIACDVIAMSGGWTPAVQLFTQSGGTLRHDPAIDAFVPDTSVQAERSCGAAAGASGLGACAASGMAAGIGAAMACGFGEAIAADAAPPIPAAIVPVTVPPGIAGKMFVDFQTDATVADLVQATRENYRSVEHVKRYTVWGMGTDQGRLGAANGVRVLADLQGRAPGEMGTTKFRPPFAATTIATLSAARPNGALFRPWRQLPAHRWHQGRGAVFEDFGWLRPSHYPRPGETMHDAAQREALAVRNGVGLIDSSSLGKIELKGPEAGAFLDRMSAGRPSTIAVGRVRYNLLLDELGVLIDDGVVARLAEDHFLLSASSGHAQRVVRHLEEWLQCEWPMDLVLRDVTAQWAVLTLTGSRAAAVLAAAGCDIAPFPHLGVREGHVAGVPVRIQRVSFTGEASYEIALPPDRAEAMAAHLMLVGEPHGLIPFGLEALDILRLEKGYIHVGGDTDGTTQPADIGWGKGVKREGDFIGRRSLRHASGRRPGRQQLVGLVPEATDAVPIVGSHIIGGDPNPSQGFITSACLSPTLGHGIALALLNGGQARHGEVVTLWSEGETMQATVTAPCFLDPEGARLHD